MHPVSAQDFASWREAAKRLLQAGIPPAHVLWNATPDQMGLFPDAPLPPASGQQFSIPAAFLQLAEQVACHRHDERFNLLYHMLWRLVHENKQLLHIATDPLTNALEMMQISVQRDVHKTKAFVRFRKTEDADGQEHYIAWHRPDHRSLTLSAPFFSRRFSTMNWTILTPDESAFWDGSELRYGPGATSADAPTDDEMELLWKEFYRAIFNPARIKIGAMKKEMPVRHWRTLPEAAIIKDILAEAPERVRKMIAHSEGHAHSAQDFIPLDAGLDELRAASKSCEGCPLYRQATHTVFGEGPKNAEIMLLGEQPGDEEDKVGRPFVGPAGEVLNHALKDAGLARETLYLTNAVKHFKFSWNGDRRHHRTPSLKEMIGCKPWLEAELKSVQPKLVVALGATAARAVINPGFKITENRGKFYASDTADTIATYHPSAVLRSDNSEEIYNFLVHDLRLAKAHKKS